VDVKISLAKEDLLAIAGDSDAIVVRSQTMIDADVLDAATQLKVVARAGSGRQRRCRGGDPSRGGGVQRSDVLTRRRSSGERRLDRIHDLDSADRHTLTSLEPTLTSP
jgi:hypothetical protein